MAFGKGSGSNFPPGTKVYYVKIRSKDLPAPIFEVAQKGEDGKPVIVDPAATRVSGNIIGVNHKEFTNPKNKEVIKSVTVMIQDGNEAYYVGVPYSYLGRGIMNSILALTKFGGVEMSLYQSKPKPDSVNKTGFASCALRQNGELVYGRFKKEDLPEIKKVKVGDKTFSDDAEINAFFKAHIEELNKVIKAKTPEVSGELTHTEPVSGGATNFVTGEDLDSDVPF